MKTTEIIRTAGKTAFAVILTGMYACNSFLDVVPKDQVSDQTLWQSIENADLFLNSIYTGVPGPFNSGDPLENYSDNAINGISGRYSTTVYGNSSYTPANGPSQWGHYANIRKCNLFIEKANESQLPDSWKKVRLGEARFLRAYYYTLLALHHGGVPVITDVLNQNTQGESIFRPRNTFEETIRFITDECAAIAEDLPLTASSGRVTKGAALTLKAWCELFTASPMYNPSGNKEKWKQAAATYQKVIDLDVYKLFPDYGTLFLEANNNNIEVIFDKAYLGGTNLGNAKTSNYGPTFVDGVARGFAGTNPTQELVDEYAMANGLPITDPLSGYDPQKPYVNREKRFYDDIIYDGAEWLGSEIVMKQGVGSRNQTDLSDNNEATNTGYYWRKGVDPKYATVGNNQNSAHFIIFRYAEVLLAYAEAQNEAAGPDASVYKAVNQVRQRVSLPALKEGLSQEEMRIAIHRERRVELSSEEKRWYDIIRLKLADKVLNGSLHAILIGAEQGKWVYKKVPAAGGARIFHPEKNYLYPIPQSAIDTNPKLVQNPNY